MGAAAPPPGDFLMAVSGDSAVVSWDLRAMRLVVSGSLDPLFRSVTVGAAIVPNSAAGAAGKAGSLAASRDSSGSSFGAASAAAAAGSGVGAAQQPQSQLPRVVRCGVGAGGSPAVLIQCAPSTAGGGGALQGFTLHPGLQTWLRLADGRSALSDYYGGSGLGADDAWAGGSLGGDSTGCGGRLATWPGGGRVAAADGGPLEGATAAGSGAVARWQASVTRAHIEESMACALLLESPQELAQWLGLYVRHLAAVDASGGASATASMRRLRSVCDKLLHGRPPPNEAVAAATPPGEDGGGSLAADGSSPTLAADWGEGPTILGLDKRRLLREVVLPAMSANRALQRLGQEYADALDADAAGGALIGTNSLGVASASAAGLGGSLSGQSAARQGGSGSGSGGSSGGGGGDSSNGVGGGSSSGTAVLNLNGVSTPTAPRENGVAAAGAQKAATGGSAAASGRSEDGAAARAATGASAAGAGSRLNGGVGNGV
ncbi:unnamed protein product [Phaeothamnion confervicola]